MDYLQSAQSFVRALKAPTDPPIPGAPLKIDIARQAWNTPTFAIPNKGEVILEWIFSKFLKERSKPVAFNPLGDVSHWHLLQDIMTPTPSKDFRTNVSSKRTWLAPFWGRASFSPVLIATLIVLGELDKQTAVNVAEAFASCFTTIWPLSVSKIPSETLLDCFGACLRLLGKKSFGAKALGIHTVCSAVASAYQSSVSNVSNRKKLYALFLSHHLACWVEVVSNPEASYLEQEIYATGIDTLFNNDTICQTMSTEALSAALVETRAKNPVAFFAVLPRLLSSFVNAARRHKSAIATTGAGDAVEQVRVFLYDFFETCLAWTAEAGDESYVWKARNALLDVVDIERLFSYRDDKAKTSLSNQAKLALSVIYRGAKEEFTTHKLALETLTLLTRIEFDVISPIIPRIIPALLFVGASLNTAAVPLLELLLDFYSKTRSLPSYITLLLTALEPSSSASLASFDYHTGFLGPVLSIAHLDKLGLAIRAFITSSQVNELVNLLLTTIRNSLEHFTNLDAKLSADEGEGARKKRRKSQTHITSASENDIGQSATSFAFVVHVASVVLVSLPIKSIKLTALGQIRANLEELRETVLRPTTSLGLKSIKKNRRSANEGWQEVLVALLKLQSSLAAGVQPLLRPSISDQKVWHKLLKAISEDHASQELLTLTYYSLLRDVSSGMAENSINIAEGLLQCLEQSIPARSAWSGYTSDLAGDALGVALMYMLLHRWLGEFQYSASLPQLERLAKLLLSIQAVDMTTDGSLTTSEVVVSTLYTADFWEMSNLRDAIFAAIMSDTAFLDEFKLQNVLDMANSEKKKKLDVDLSKFNRLGMIFRFLLRAPTEYIPRPVRIELYRRAMVADVLVDLQAKEEDAQPMWILSTFLRSFMLRSGMEQQIDIEFVTYLLQMQPRATSVSYKNTTLDLVKIQFSSIIRNSEKGSGELERLIGHLSSYDLKVIISNNSGAVDYILAFVGIVMSRLSLSETPSQLLDYLVTLQDSLYRTLSPILDVLCLKAEASSRSNTILDTWQHSLALRRWLSLDTTSATYGRRLLTAFAPVLMKVEDLTVRSSLGRLLFIVINEERRANSSHEQHSNPEMLVASYTILRKLDNTDTLEDASIKIWRSLSLADFTLALGMISESMIESGQKLEHYCILVHLLSMLLRHAPEGTLKVTQTHFTRCTSLFATNPELWLNTPVLRLEVLKLISAYCSERPASLRTTDVSNLLSTFSYTLAHSITHDPRSSPPTFHVLVAALGALVRMRRDLVTAVLPHVGHLLRQLITAFRRPRPQLGAKQTQQVINLLPAWISFADDGLGPLESRALARLLTSFTTKTTVRTYSAAPNPGEDSASSLARPFSKHAAPVLSSYIDAMNDPLSVIPADVRKELQPGLFALCEMMNEHSRDALVASSLDTGGKTILKTLWKEWEKQRYVGKG